MPDPVHDPYPLLKLIETYKTRQDVHEVFGLILYTKGDPYVIKALRDEDFWNALDAKSGPRWPIFSIRPGRGKFVQQTQAEFLVDLSGALDSAPGKWNEPFENQELLNQLEIVDTTELPALMIFSRGPNGEVLRTAVSLVAGSVDECYQKLSGAIDAAAEAIKDVKPENIKNTYEVFSLIEGAIGQRIFFQRIKQGLSFAEWLKSVFSLLSGA